ncbi:MAG: PAS domain S-box protein, partial [Syntrophales bacterium]
MPNLKKSKSRSVPKKSRVLKESAKKMETVFREDQELFKRLISFIPDAVILTDMNGKVIFVNDFGVRLLGYSGVKKIIGKNVLTLIVPQQHEMARKTVEQRLKADIGPRDYTVITEDGRKIPFEFNGNVLKKSDGTPFAKVHVCRDIS